MTAPVLILACGNPSRGDDALGPQLLALIAALPDITGVELLQDFQLQIEHALDLQDRKLVLFVDACITPGAAFRLQELVPQAELGYTTHAMAPAGVLEVYRRTLGGMPPPSFLLTILGRDFGLGDGLSIQAGRHLQLAAALVAGLLAEATPVYWRQMARRTAIDPTPATEVY